MYCLVVLIALVAQAAGMRVVSMTQSTPASPKSLFNVKKPLYALLSASSMAATLLFSKPQVANAFSVEEANQLLSGYSFPPILYVPPGFSPLVSEFGRGNIKKGFEKQNPILVQFCHPSLWVVQKTSVNNNGESGTIAANDYAKGDSAFLFVTPVPEGEKIVTPAPASKAAIQKIVLKSLSQKGDPVDSFKMGEIKAGSPGSDGTPYVIAAFSYELNTEAGFLIARKGYASIATIGPNVQALIALTTAQRFTKNGMGEKLLDIVNSFRAYRLTSGIFAGAGERPVSPVETAPAPPSN